MALTINTNLGSLIVQKNLDDATKALNKSIERMTTGYKINSASDDAAGYAVATKMQTQLSSISVAQDNVAIGSSLLSTAESNYDLITTHLQRIRDLTEQAANGTYGQDSIDAIKAEISARWEEIDRIAANTEYNGIKLLDGSQGTGITLQVGIDSTANSQLQLDAGLFANAETSALTGVAGNTFAGYFTVGGADYDTALDAIDKALDEVTARQTEIGAMQNRLDSAADALDVQYSNVTSSLSTIKDADIAEESSNYIKAQILQQASSSLLATANQTPSIALNLIRNLFFNGAKHVLPNL